jgi:hypothetical protein
MPQNYQALTFTRSGSSAVEHGLYLSACTDETGNYLSQRVVVLKKPAHGGPLEVLPFGSLTVVQIL